MAALGKSGSISELLKTLGSMSPDGAASGARDQRPARPVAAAIAERKAALEAAELDAKLAAERVDLTLPPPPERRGPRAPDHAGAWTR